MENIRESVQRILEKLYGKYKINCIDKIRKVVQRMLEKLYLIVAIMLETLGSLDPLFDSVDCRCDHRNIS